MIINITVQTVKSLLICAICLPVYGSILQYKSVQHKQTESVYKVKKKGTVHPGRGHEGPEGQQRYIFTLSLTLELDRGGWSRSHSGPKDGLD
jgi:hypothetical protein